MKKILSFIFAILMLLGVCLAASCGETPVEPTTSSSSTAATPEVTTATTQTTETTETSATTPEVTTASETTAATETTDVEEPTLPEDASLKILAIGNSFSVDAMEYVYNIAKAVGYKEVVLGNLYIGGCSLQTHILNLSLNAKGYTYYYNNSGAWHSRSSNVASEINAEDWDYISIQQVSGDSGRPETYEPYLTQLIDYIKEHAPNAEIMWHMTWAYPLGSDYSSFVHYGYNQKTMYDSIVSTVKSLILDREEISFVIPVGTAIQNVRTSYYGDNLSRDNLHLSYDVGRYIAGMMWVRQISGVSIDDVDWIPVNSEITPRLLSTIKEAVNNAYDHPYEVTPASDVQASSIEEVLAAYGIDPSDYTALPLGLTFNAYYNSISSSAVQSVANGGTATNYDQFACTKIYEKDDLPRGTLLVVIDGCQFRPEGWKKLTSVNSSATRPANVTKNVTVVDGDWWGEFAYRAFNISKVGNPNLTAEQMKALENSFAILVPNDPNADVPEIPDKIAVDLEKIVTDAGYVFDDYVPLDFEVTFYAYYNSTSNPLIVSRAGGDTASNLNQFAATSKKFDKNDIPVGSLIVIVDGYQYRPEGWVNLNSRNASADRPVNVTKGVVEVDQSWWGRWTYRAFNIAQKGNPALNDEQMKQLDNVLFILVPAD